MSKRTHDQLSSDGEAPAVHLSGGQPQPDRQIELWRQSRLCDVEVKVEGQAFKAHRLVLASSDFLAACLETSMSEQAGARIVLRDVSASTFAQVLEFLYTGKASAAPAALLDMLEAAARLQLAPLVQAVVVKVKETLCASNVLASWDLAQRLQLPELRELEVAARLWALDNFREVAANIEDASLASLTALVSSPALKAPEEDAFRAVVRWVRRHNPSSGDARKLWQQIYFRAMPATFVNETVRAEPLMEPHMDVLMDSLLGPGLGTRVSFVPHVEQGTSQLEYTWKIPNFSSVLASRDTGSKLKVVSPIFSASNVHWQICLSVPPGSDTMGVFLQPVGSDSSPRQFRSYTLGLVGTPSVLHTSKTTEPFPLPSQYSGLGWGFGSRGWQNFIKLERLTQPVADRFLVDDTLTVKAAVEW